MRLPHAVQMASRVAVAINRGGDKYDQQGVPMYRVRVYDAQLRKQSLDAHRRALPARRFGPAAAVDDRDAALPLKGPLGPDAAGGRLGGGAT